MAMTESWRATFAALARLVKSARVLKEAGQVYLCFQRLAAVDDHNDGEYSAWCAAFKPEESPIPDGFYLALMQISIPATQFWRIRRLQEMTAEERGAAAKDIDVYLRKPTSENSNDSSAGLSTERGEGYDVGAGAAGGAERADTLSEAEEGGVSGNKPERLEPDVVLVFESDGYGLAADSGHGDEQDEAALKDTARRNSEAMGFTDTSHPGEHTVQG